MAGIYIHIPFCKQACYYCDFHFSTSLQLKKDIVDCICHEIVLQKGYLQGVQITTVYWGGGTPSMLDEEDFKQIFDSLRENFSITENAEITLEANPDDLNQEKLIMLKKQGFNRLSIGIQSFNSEVLKHLNRAHTSTDALNCIMLAHETGFKNINVDLIYASEHLSDTMLLADLSIICNLNIQHISAYNLTIEPGTVFGSRLKKGLIKPVNDEISARQYSMIEAYLKEKGFIHYEISNYALPGKESRHNTSYWKQEHYLGIGPSAHSYNGIQRQYNVKNNAAYIENIKKGIIPCEIETLSKEQQITEYLMTGLRTIWGCNTSYLSESLGYDILKIKSLELEKFSKTGWLTITDKNIVLSNDGRLFTDSIVLELIPSV